MINKTYSAKPSDIERKWYIIDATDLVLGRLASEISMRVRGKHKAQYTTHMNCGDNIIVINAEKVHLTGKKRENQVFYWHTGFAGGIKERTLGQRLESKDPGCVITKAVERMIARKSKALYLDIMRNLHVYAGPNHPHQGQNPQVIDFASKNKKNKKEAI
jgi:large subunit ribosomal protein L13